MTFHRRIAETRRSRDHMHLFRSISEHSTASRSEQVTFHNRRTSQKHHYAGSGLLVTSMVIALVCGAAADSRRQESSGSSASTRAGDRGHGLNMIYPGGAFRENGGPIIDIAKAPYNARGSGDPKDADHNTKAFVAVYDFIMAELDKHGDMQNRVTQPSSTNCSYIVYIPSGVYYVNNTLIYSGPVRKVAGVQREYCVWLRFIGQSRRKTIVRLVDKCPGFDDKKNPKPIFSFGKKRDVNPMKANNVIRNLTIDAGSGNPGTVGIRWTSANNGAASELVIRSGDGEGFVGYDFSMGGPCGYFRDMIIEGFDYGIRLGTHRRHFYNPTLEYISLTGQKEAGILFEAGSGTLRKIKSENAVPAIRITDAYTHAVVLDSQFTGIRSAATAVEIVDEGFGIGHLFARNVAVSGYGAGIKKNGAVVCRTSVGEYVSDPIRKFSPDVPDTSMNLPIEEVPFVPWEQDLSKWTTAGRGDGTTDDSAAIQQAMNDPTKSVFYFPKRHYRIRGTVHIPAHIKVVDFMFSRISGSTPFRVSEDAPEPVLFRDLCKSGNRSRVFIEQDGMRTVYAEMVPGRFGNPGNHPGSKAFLCIANIARADRDYGIKNAVVYWRWGNDEYRDHLFTIGDNCRVVILGYKTEGGGVGFNIAGTSEVEILGGVHTNHGRPLWYTDAYPYVQTHGAGVSIITRFIQSDKTYKIYLQDDRRGTAKTFASTDFPEIGTSDASERIIPLYIGYGGKRK